MPWQVMLNVLLLPVLAGLQAPFVGAGPLDCCAHVIAAKSSSAICFIAPCNHFCGCLGGCFLTPSSYVTEFPSPVTAGLSGPVVLAGPETCGGGVGGGASVDTVEGLTAVRIDSFRKCSW